MQINKTEFDLSNIQVNDIIEIYDSQKSNYYIFKVIDKIYCEYQNMLVLINDIKEFIHKIYRQSIVLAYRNNQYKDSPLYFNTSYTQEKYSRIQRKYKVNPKLDTVSSN